MLELLFTPKAFEDLQGIDVYTLENWGPDEADRYLHQLKTRLNLLLKNPMSGRSCQEIRPALRRLEHGRHVVFYRILKEEILVIRILHQHMLPELADISEE